MKAVILRTFSDHENVQTPHPVIVKVMTSLYDQYFRFVHNGVIGDKILSFHKNLWTYVYGVGEIGYLLCPCNDKIMHEILSKLDMCL